MEEQQVKGNAMRREYIGHWNKKSRAVWVEDAETGETTVLETASTELRAYNRFAQAGYTRWDNLLPSPAPFFRCRLTQGLPEREAVTGDPETRGENEMADEDEKTYSIVRFHREGTNEVMQEGLTLEEAKEHCNRDDTHGDGWFDGFREE